MQTRYLFLCFLLLAMACGDPKIPSDVLPEKKMVGLLIDMQIADARVSGAGLRTDSAKVIMRFYEDKLFEQHAVSREHYQKSMAYYLENPKILDRIYEAMIDTLHLREQKLIKKKQEEEMEEAEILDENAPADTLELQ
jgi:hypothetical protein